MIKTFENCSPEYQITIVCFFIFLTLLCMILVIYEGTGKRQRKMLLLDSVLLIVIFLITAVLCVWQRAFYEEDSMILFKIPYVILIVIGIGVFLYVGLKIFGICYIPLFLMYLPLLMGSENGKILIWFVIIATFY